MNVNSAEWSRREFVKLSSKCDSKETDGMVCSETKFVCKDYLCPIVKVASDIGEVRASFAQQHSSTAISASEGGKEHAIGKVRSFKPSTMRDVIPNTLHVPKKFLSGKEDQAD